MQVAVGVPQREHRVAVAFVLRKHAVALHSRILSVDILEDVGMDERVIECRVENGLLVFGAAFDFNSRQVGVPLLPCFLRNGVEIFALLLGVEVLTCVGYADKRHAHLHLNHLVVGGVEVHIDANIVAGHLFLIGRVELILPSVGEPFSLFARPFALLFPVTGALWHLVHAHHEVNGEHSLGIIAKGALQFHALILGGTHLFHHRSRLFRETFTKVKQQMAFAFGERKALTGGAKGGGYLGLHAVFHQEIAVIARTSHLVFVVAAICFIIDIELACGGHQQQRTHIGAANAAEVDMGKACEKYVVELVRR